MYPDRTEASWEWPDEFKREICQELYRCSWRHYTDSGYKEAILRISCWLHVPPEWILLTRGAGEALFWSILTLRQVSIQQVFVPQPGFFLYERFLKPLELNYIFYKPDAFKGLINQLEEGEAVLLCSPNNPTGHIVSPSMLQALLDHASCPFIVLDLTYDLFSRAPFLSHLSEWLGPRLLICASLSKAFALAGARLGFLIAHPELIRTIEANRDSFPMDHYQLTLINIMIPRFLPFAFQKIQETCLLRDDIYREITQWRIEQAVCVNASEYITLLPVYGNFISFILSSLGKTYLLQQLIAQLKIKYFSSYGLVRMSINEHNRQGVRNLKEQLMSS